jgi:hypothetical protein
MLGWECNASNLAHISTAMPRKLILNGTVYNYPLPGDEQKWGEDATDWAEAVTDIFSTIVGAGFIPETTITINDNVTSFTNILGASFNSAVSRSFSLSYAISRTDGSNFFTESGIINGVYDGADWDYTIERVGDAGMDFNVTSAGQLQYKSSAVGGTYSGDIHFFANDIIA